MTVDPTALQQARLHIGQIRVCWPMLDDARTARVSRPSVALSGRAAAMRDEDLRAERADRDAAVSYRALAASPAPLALGVLDAESEAVAVLADLTWRIRSDLRQWSTVLETPPGDINGRLTWLTTHLEHTLDDIVRQAATDLRQASRVVAGAAGHQLDDDWRKHHGRCPACGQAALHRWALSPDRREWAVECNGQTTDERGARPCRCAGEDDCPCRRPGARRGTPHLWSCT